MYGGYLDNNMIATIFLTQDYEEIARIKSVAILEEYQKRGLGRYLMEYVEDIARKRGYIKVNLMGRVSVEDFYKKLGYKTTSAPFDYHTIPHINMEKNLWFGMWKDEWYEFGNKDIGRKRIDASGSKRW